MAENENVPSVRYWGPQDEDNVDPNEVAATLLARINERAKARKSAMHEASSKQFVSENKANGDVKSKKKNKTKNKGKVDINTFDAVSKDALNTSFSANNASEEHIANGDISEKRKKKIKADMNNVSFTGDEENLANDIEIESTPKRKKKKSKEGIETENKEIPNDEIYDSSKEPTPKKKKKKSIIAGEIQDNGIPNGETEHVTTETTPKKKKKKSTIEVENKDTGEESIGETPRSEKKKLRNRTESGCNEAEEIQNSGNNNLKTKVEESGKKRKEKRKRKGSESVTDTDLAKGNKDNEILNGEVGNINEVQQSEKKKKSRNRTQSLSSEVGGMQGNRSNNLKAKVENSDNNMKGKRKRAESESVVDSVISAVDMPLHNKIKGRDTAAVYKPNAQNLQSSNITVNGRAPPNKKARGNEQDIRNKEKGKGAQGNNTKAETEYEGFTMLREMIRDNKTKVERVLPYWMSNPVKIDTDINKEKVPVDSMLGLDATLKATLLKNNIEYFFPVQKHIIPELLSNATSMTMRYRPRDVCVSAPTGSGKTLAYVLPLVQALASRRVRRIRALVILPVRELAIQVHKVFIPYAKVKGLKVGLACGEITFAREQKSLVSSDYAGYHSLADILVATPGRLADHLSLTKGFDLSDLRFLILDEADHLIKMDGGTCIERIEQTIKDFLGVPKNAVLEMQAPDMFQFPKPTLQRLLFSATLTSNPEELKVVPLYRPKLFAVCSVSGAGTKSSEVKKFSRPDTLTEEFIVTEESVKPLVVHHLVQSREWNKVLIFTNSIESTHKLAVLLSIMAKEKTVVEISKLIDKRTRFSILKDFLLGKINILVSSDVMARGLDVPNIDNVVCYDITSPKTYIHRIGRTARAGACGTAVSLIPKEKIGTFKRKVSSGGKVKEFSIPTEELEPYESMYVDALEKLKETLETEKQKEWEKVQKANMPRRAHWKGQGHKGARFASLHNREKRETNK